MSKSKKIITALLVTAGIASSFAGCSENKSSTSDTGNSTSAESSAEQSTAEETTKAVRKSTAPIDEAIIGKWWNGTNGYIFGEDRKMSLVVDFSAMDINFTKDGEFNKGGDIISKDDITYDGKNLMVQYKTDTDISIMVNMTRNDGENPDSIDGTYTMLDGILLQYFAQNVGINLDDVKKDDDLEFLAEIDGEKLILTLENYCEYETIGDSLEMFSKFFTYVDESADAVKYKYKIEGDTLTMTYEVDGEEFDEVYERAEE